MAKISATSILAITWACCTLAPASEAAAAEADTASPSDPEIVVTANKREQDIQSVPMSIQAVSGDDLIERGVNSTADLIKLVPGLTARDSGINGAPQFGLRGVIFLDPSLAANPTVSIYNDQVPLPFSIEAIGSTLDLERVEVLKGPQGTLFGSNATGGAINYIANKPTDNFEAGADIQYGRFNTLDAQGFLSGPLTGTLNARVALRTVQADGWQKNYVVPGQRLGARNFTTGRVIFDWQPSDRLSITTTLAAFSDRSETPAPQFVGLSPLDPTSLPPIGVRTFPVAPENPRAASWSPCINDSPRNLHCVGYRRNNRFYSGSLRVDYDLGSDITLTSLTAYHKFKQYQPTDADGQTFKIVEYVNTGYLETTYQELRLSGSFGGEGNWIVGGNYEHDDTVQNGYFTALDSSSGQVGRAITIDPIVAINLTNAVKMNTYAGFAHVEYPIAPTLTVEGGIRYTESKQDFEGCQRDGGNGLAAKLFNTFFGALGYNAVAGGCVTLRTGPTGFSPVLVQSDLDENNISYRVGANWQVTPDVMLYANVSQGYKAGSYSGLSATSEVQYNPALQEKLIAYEAGIKSELFDRKLLFNASVFHYDYTDKQIQGRQVVLIFGALPRLINIPKSRVNGVEVSAVMKPVEGFTLASTLSYADSKILGCKGEVGANVAGCHLGDFFQYNHLGQIQNFTGTSFPGVAELQANVDAQYEWNLSSDVSAYIGGNVSFQGSSPGTLGEDPILDQPKYTLVDLRAGVKKGPLGFQIWGRNVFNEYYYTTSHTLDAYTRSTGMPATYGVTLNYRFR